MVEEAIFVHLPGCHFFGTYLSNFANLCNCVHYDNILLFVSAY